jgi:hypothetical protein
MKVGDIVEIYEKPMTNERLEGRAKLVRLLTSDYDRELWEVKFVGDDAVLFLRWIKKEMEEAKT